ncbi:MAG TPA: 30S ribosomal protein S16 [Bacteroidales bacterium]|nr:30S ribosomal protein S16 [Bacteroidales bacterium]
MPVKIRLARHGRKSRPFYYIVVANSRAPRDGRFIERIGSYNPMTNPATIDLNFDAAMDWLQKGAQPTDTARAVLSYKGVYMKKHLLEGVKKGALTLEQAEVKFQTWVQGKEAKIQAKKDGLKVDGKNAGTAQMAAEAKVKEQRTAAIAKAKADAHAAKNAEVSSETAETTED